jgi:hypothetical protein
MVLGMNNINKQKPITIRQLYPDMSDEELAAAEANLTRYVAMIARIYGRLKAEGKEWPGLKGRYWRGREGIGLCLARSWPFLVWGLIIVSSRLRHGYHQHPLAFRPMHCK